MRWVCVIEDDEEMVGDPRTTSQSGSTFSSVDGKVKSAVQIKYQEEKNVGSTKSVHSVVLQLSAYHAYSSS